MKQYFLQCNTILMLLTIYGTYYLQYIAYTIYNIYRLQVSLFMVSSKQS